MTKQVTGCPVEYTANLIGNKWKMVIVRDLITGPKRPSDLSRSLTGITPKVLTENLRALEADGLVARKVFPVVPPKVEYSLTEKGEDLKEVFAAMRQFGAKWQTKT